ncbi:hypothetical protein Tco_0815982 [Tanacetum coccineum]
MISTSTKKKRLSSLRTQLGQQQDDMIRKTNLLWKTVSKKLNDAPILESAGNSLASKNIDSICHIEKGELKRKGIKSPSKLFSPKHHARTRLKHNERKWKGEVKEVIDEEESEVETDEEVKEILKDEEGDEDGKYFNSFPTMEELTHHEWLLKNPRPP